MMRRRILLLALVLTGALACSNGTEPPGGTDDLGQACAASQTAFATSAGTNLWTVTLYYNVVRTEHYTDSQGVDRTRQVGDCQTVVIHDVSAASEAEAIVTARQRMQQVGEPGTFNG